MSLSPDMPMAEDNVEIEEISVEEFYERVSRKNDVLLLDVRNDRDFEEWRIESPHTPERKRVCPQERPPWARSTPTSRYLPGI